MSAWAKPGATCVCVRISPVAADLGFVGPKAGQVYTIRDVRRSNRYSDGVADVGIALEEIHNPPRHWPNGEFGEPLWLIDNFRPLVTRTQEQDMAIFRPLLETIGEEA